MSFRYKTKKTRDDLPIVIYPTNGIVGSWREPYIQILSIDPGSINLAIYCERRYINGYVEGLHTSLNNVRSGDNGTIELLYHNINRVLDNLSYLWSTTHIVIIERQPPDNYTTVRVSQHIISYMMMYLRSNGLDSIIVEMSSKSKDRYIGVPSSMTGAERKKKITEIAKDYLLRRYDHATETERTRYKKTDDVSDAIMQVEGFCAMKGDYPLTANIYEILVRYGDPMTVSKIVKNFLSSNPSSELMRLPIDHAVHRILESSHQ